MKNGTCALPFSRKKIFLVTALVLALCAVGGTIAWLATSSNSVTNTFIPAKVTNEIHETIDGTTKKNVFVENTGTTDAYIRAAIIINWVDENGMVTVPFSGADSAYVLDVNTMDWTKSSTTDGTPVYYYKSAVPVKGKTTDLINSVSEVPNKIPDGYHLKVTIVSEAIQATGMGTTSAQDTWAEAAKG